MYLAMAVGQTAKDKLLGAALALFREKGFTATTVDDLCARAGVTKGAFFHHFKTKEDVGVAAADHWSAVTGVRTVSSSPDITFEETTGIQAPRVMRIGGKFTF